MDHSTDQTASSTPLASANAVDQEAAMDNTVLIRGMDLDVFNAAKEGKTDVLSLRKHRLDQILTPTKNTVLHIYIAFASSPNFVEPKEKALRPPSVVDKILHMCPALLLQKNESGETALHIAARHGRADIVELLIKTAKAGPCEDLENGPSSSVDASWQKLIRETNKEKDTALHFAVRFNHFRVVEILTREDPDFSYSANDAGETPLYLAAERKYGVLFSQILSTCTDPNYQGPIGRTALHAAVIYGDKSI
ncbi:protein ACCELERATED CELL DEATH 6-like [Prunus yedoensis var. nudiflora]|uniref:Protein ACCELERATED CELL DEATH 6-like n=1 Tax=Prunus yedoensis var. nudiflora TaxID=2094558 RepID=A0A314YAR9_PRUYE|nr:protein ACCELERATED CELL DEATH 6-like [Prunus yedoensis var. nudiflora]